LDFIITRGDFFSSDSIDPSSLPESEAVVEEDYRLDFTRVNPALYFMANP
jgi:hypothetical protein